VTLITVGITTSMMIMIIITIITTIIIIIIVILATHAFAVVGVLVGQVVAAAQLAEEAQVRVARLHHQHTHIHTPSQQRWYA
jgi:c-di-AMP phosphodiesterase-like protein